MDNYENTLFPPEQDTPVVDPADHQKMMQLAEQLIAAKQEKKELEDQTKAATAEIERLDRELSDLMAKMDCPNFTHAGYTFYLSSRLFVSPQSGRKEALFTALRSNGYGSIVTETINANTLASFVKERMEENDGEIPEWLSDVVNTHEKISVGVRKK